MSLPPAPPRLAPDVTARLMAALPESLWAEASRRLRLVPELWQLAQDHAILDAWCALRQAALWQPGRLALAAFGVRHPECLDTEPSTDDAAAQLRQVEAWLEGAGRERTAAAYFRLTSSPPASAGEGLHPIDDALPAALALRVRASTTHDWQSLAEEAAAQPGHWRLALQYLWGLSHSPDGLFAALMRSGPEGARLAAQVVLANLSPAEAAQAARNLPFAAEAGQWLEFARAAEMMAGPQAARAVLQSITAQADGPHQPRAQAHSLASQIDGARLLAAAGEYGRARPALAQVWVQARRLRSELAARIGELALRDNDPVTAFAGFHDALAEQPDDPDLRAGMAHALLRLDRPAEALAALRLQGAASAPPELALAGAQAQLALGSREAAHSLLRQVDLEHLDEPDLLCQAARLLVDLKDTAGAIGLLKKAAAAARTDAGLFLEAATCLLEAGRSGEARDYAAEAAALAPEDAGARETLGRALLEAGEPERAVPHFQSAAVFDPGRISASLGLARAALEAGQAVLAQSTAQHILSTAEDTEVQGQAHTLFGRALSLLNKDDEAFEHFRRASVLVPAQPEPWRAMARHFADRGEGAQALAVLEAGRQALALISSPHIAPLLTDLARSYEAAGRFTEAITALREACEAAGPQATAERRRLGGLLRRQGHLAEAIEVFRDILQVTPGEAAVLHELGLALEQIGLMDDAWAAFQQAVLARPAGAEAYIDLGRLTLLQCANQSPAASPLQAITALQTAIERQPDSAEAHALLAQAHQLAGDPHRALDSYRRALHLAPTRTDWSLGLGEVCLQLQRPEAAITALREALEHTPEAQAGRVHHHLARAYAQSGLWPEARQHAERALRFDPDGPLLLAFLAEIYAHLDMHDRAVDALRQAVARHPRDAHMHIRLARGLVAAGRAAEARSVFAQALSLAPDSGEVLLQAGLALLEMGELEQAYDLLTQAAGLSPRSPAAQAALGRAAARSGRHDAAHAAFLRAAELDSESARGSHLREAGEALWDLGRRAAAVALWQRALSLKPGDHGLMARLGSALLSLGQNGEALAALEVAAAQEANDGAIAREAGRAALVLGQLEKAGHYLEHAINLNPGDAESRYLLGQVREAAGDPAQALACYRQAARLGPGDGRFLAASANTLARTGKVAEALDLIEQALGVSPDSPEVQQTAGEIYLLADMPAAAARAFGRAVSARPRDAEAHLALARALTVLAETLEGDVRAGLHPKESPDEVRADLLGVLQKAAALGASPQWVRYWMGRARTVIGESREAEQLLESAAGSAQIVAREAARLYRALGAARRKAGRLEQAREALQAALQHDPQSPDGHIELGLTLAALGDPNGALAAFKRAAAARPAWGIGFYHLAQALLALGERPQAALVMQRAISLQPDAAAWHHALANIQHELGDSAAALAHFQRAAELEPQNGGFAADLARALSRDGDLARAVELYRRATDAQPGSAPLWTEQGQAHLALGDLNSAAACFARAILLAPASIPALLGSARTSLGLGDLPDAVNKAQAAARLAPDDPDVMMCLAEVQSAQGDMTAAEASYSAAAARSSRPLSALLALGRLLFTTGKLDKAQHALERAAASHPDDDNVFALLGDVRQAGGDLDGAVSAYREAARIASRSPKHLLRLGRACRAQGQLDQALSHLLQAREVDPDNEDVLREAGLVFEQRKQFDRALEMYRLALKAAPASASSHTRLGVALKQMKDYAGAVKALERAVELDPKNLEATKQLAVVTALNLMHGERLKA